MKSNRFAPRPILSTRSISRKRSLLSASLFLICMLCTLAGPGLAPVASVSAATVAPQKQSKDVVEQGILDRTDPPPPADPNAPSAVGELVTTPDNDYARRTSRAGLGALGDDAFGEQTDPITGALSFLQVDILASGTGPGIALHRSFDVAKQGSIRWPHFGAFADWDLEVPRITTEIYNGDEANPANPFTAVNFPPRGPWLGSSGGAAGRCSSFGSPPAPTNTNGGIPIESRYWWRGVQLLIPGEGGQELLQRAAGNPLTPTSNFGLPGNPAFPIVTTDHWMIGCLSSTANGEPGEAFFAVSPTGTKYWFNWLVYDFVPSLNLPEPIAKQSPLLRVRASMLVTRIEDSHGNAVTFQYSGRNLTRVTAPDGRELTISYRTDVSSSEPLFPLALVNTVTLQPLSGQPRIWQYEYDGITPGGVMNQVSMRSLVLKRIVLPDNSAWSFAMGTLNNICGIAVVDKPFGAPTPVGCVDSGQTDNRTFSGSITGPSGLTGTFNVKKLIHSRNGSPTTPYPAQVYNPFASRAASLVSKSYSGSGVSKSWAYTYSPSAAEVIDRDVNCATYPSLCGVSTATTTTVKPDSTVSVASFENDWGASLGDLTRLDEGAVLSGGVVVSAARTTTWDHASPTAGPYPSPVGNAPASYINNDRLQTLRPVNHRVIAQDGATFEWQASSFDAYARVLQSTSTSSLGFSRAETVAYVDRTDPWVIGLVDTVSIGGFTNAAVDNDYSALGDLTRVKQFDKIKQVLTYNSDGTLSTRTDEAGVSHRVVFSDYKMGVPRQIDYPGGAQASAIVDDFGQITSVTDTSTFTTTYGFDAVGRSISVTYPSGDTVAWNATSVIYEFITTSEVGLAANHWRQTTTTGSAVEVTYYDALWRPVLTKTYDATDEANTRRMVLTRYDALSRVSFASYPQRLISSVSAKRSWRLHG